MKLSYIDSQGKKYYLLDIIDYEYDDFNPKIPVAI